LASHNAKKIKELKDILAVLSVELLSADDFNIPAIEETGLTFIENALLKARHVAIYVKYPVIADDSGLVVRALKGEPGVYSSRYAGENASDAERIDKLLQALQGVPQDQREAYFYSCVVMLRHDKDPMPLMGEGVWKGSILTQPVGTHGLGYDPVFYVPTHGCSAAELEPVIKNKMSHRYQALKQLISRLS
jgi:XTP/dITP diphosphohydrolase